MSDTMDSLATDYFAALKEIQPTWAHMLSDYSFAASYEDSSRAAEDAEIAMLRDFAARAEALDEGGLDAQQQLSRAVLVSSATSRADLVETRLTEIAADPIFGPQVALPIVMGMLAVPDTDVAEAMVSKLEGVGRSFEQLAERLREGLAHGRAPAEFAVSATIAQIDESLSRPASEDPLVRAPTAPSGIDESAWRGRLAEAVESTVRPGVSAYRKVLGDEVLPRARPDDQCGLCWLEDGAETYARALRYYTTTSRTAQDIHDTGLRQLEALSEEYRALGPEVVGSTDLGEIFEALRTDPALHFSSADQLIDASRAALARAQEAMPDWFAVLPQAPCAVEATTTGAKAFYFPPAPDGSRGGTFFVNVNDPEAWGTFELESMAYHEGVPGHHLQLSISSELEGIPEFRKHVRNAAYAEGWGLYSERLADEMALYTSPVDRMGMLSADSLRACRMVVDTGLHALGWSRQQAVDFMVEHSPMTEAIVRPEIDRYIVSPGQATSYMVGRLEIQRMRAEAEQRQGFDIKAFHSAVLDSGALPLDVLDRVVRARVG